MEDNDDEELAEEEEEDDEEMEIDEEGVKLNGGLFLAKKNKKNEDEESKSICKHFVAFFLCNCINNLFTCLMFGFEKAVLKMSRSAPRPSVTTPSQRAKKIFQLRAARRRRTTTATKKKKETTTMTTMRMRTRSKVRSTRT
jgi:hypothetical protein